MAGWQDYFDDTTTDVLVYDKMLKGERKFETAWVDGEWKEFKISSEVELMSPDEYLERCCIVNNSTIDGVLRMVGKKHLEYLMGLLDNEDFRFPLPFLNMVRCGQEGRHRAVIAKNLGLNEIPVLVIRERRAGND